MGSSLRLDGRGVWPPSPWEVIVGYKNIEGLMDDRVAVGDVIDRVSIKSVYSSLLKDVAVCGFTEDDPAKRLILFPYDWRKSNEGTAALLANRLDEASRVWDLPDEITIVAHSMGGLVSRRLLEGGDYIGRSWFSRIKRLITLGTPHFGTPKALLYLTGKEGMLGVSGKDVIKLASDRRYNSLYELAGPSSSAFILNSPLPGEVPDMLGRFDRSIVNALKLQADNIKAADAFWSRMDLANRPSGVKYYFFGSASHTTVTAFQLDGGDFASIDRASSGDGTVPISSSIVVGIPHGFSRKEHVQIFEDRDVRRTLYRFLDAPSDVKPQAADTSESGGTTDRVGLSVNKEIYKQGEPIEIVVSYSERNESTRESFGFLRVDPRNPEEREPVANIDIALAGRNVTSFAVTIDPKLEPGMYQLITNRSSDDPEQTIFYVIDHD